jgi:hypothetical protein
MSGRSFFFYVVALAMPEQGDTHDSEFSDLAVGGAQHAVAVSSLPN